MTDVNPAVGEDGSEATVERTVATSSRRALARNDEGIRNRLFDVFAELVEVRVVTVVGNASVRLVQERPGGAIKTQVTTDDQPMTDALVTTFDLIDGDVTHVIPPSLRDDAELLAAHSAQVERSLRVLPDNVRALAELGVMLVEHFERE